MCIRIHVSDCYVARRVAERIIQRGCWCGVLGCGCRFGGGRVLEVFEIDRSLAVRLLQDYSCEWAYE